MELSKKRKLISKAWYEFFILYKEDISNVSDVIKESWKRSKAYGIDVNHEGILEIDEEEQKKRICSYSNFIDIARPYMVDLYNIIRETGFMITLTDKEGYILDTIISPNILENSNIKVINLSEKRIGTNAMGTCLYLDEPIQTWAEENCYTGFHRFTTCAAPIHDEYGEILGCIGITGFADVLSLHTLGMAKAVASAIENKINLLAKDDAKTIVNSYTHFLKHSISDGIIVIDKRCNITSINKKAIDILQLKDKNLEGTKLNNIFKSSIDFESIMRKEIDFHNKQFTFEIDNKPVICDVSVSNLKNNGCVIGLVIVIKRKESKVSQYNYSKQEKSLFSFEDIIGQSPSLKEAINLARIVSEGKSNVLILGESGTGKELFAQSIHNSSERRHKPFIAVNCGALPINLVESELFGYEGGSYTGAKKEGQPGKFELADGGTLFLDEIGDMPLSIQVALLRVIQEKKVYRIGSTRGKDIDIMIIAATNKNLYEAVQNNTFRIDLFYRLNVFTINIPPLRERKEDILLLCNYFIQKYNQRFSAKIKGITNDAMDVLHKYDWIGNIRELENAIERAVQISQKDIIETKDLPQYIQNAPVINLKRTFKQMSLVEEKEYKVILDILEKTNGNVKVAADQLGLSRATIYRTISKFEIDIGKFRH